MTQIESNSEFLKEIQLSGDENTDNEEIDERQHSKLLASIVSLDGKKRIPRNERSEPSLTISEFNTNEGNNEKVKVHELLSTLKQASATDLKKQVRSVSRKSKVLPIPLHRAAAEKIKRNVAYGEVGQKVSKWDSIVVSNRLADHTEFPLKQADLRIEPTKSFVSKFKPKTPLELEIAKILNSSPNTLTEDKPLTDAEEKCLKAMSYEEAKERLNELRKMRALLSYQEARARRQKKIKSKRYHRILKKDRLRKEMKEFEELQKTEPEKAAEKLLEIEKIRIEERMSLKHKNTGKWAKQHALRAKYNKESRDALSEQLEIGKKLTQKVVVVEDSDVSDDEAIKAPDLSIENGKAVAHSLPSAYNPWIKDSFLKMPEKATVKIVASENDKAASVNEDIIEVFEPDSQNEPIQDKSSSNKGDKTTNEKFASQATESTIREKKINKETNPIFKKKVLDIDEIFEMNRTPKLAKKKTNKNRNKGPRVSLVPMPVEFETTEIDRDHMDNVLEETLEKKDKMEDFATYEAVKSPSSSRTDIEEIEPTDETAKGKKVQVDPTNFVIVNAKLLKSKMPKQIEELNNDNEDSEDTDNDDDQQRRITISEAFANDDVLEEFQSEKLKAVRSGNPEIESQFLPGWGSWGGVGIKDSKRKKKRFQIKPQPTAPRKDRTLGNVIIKEGVDSQKAALHRISDLPYPFTNVEQFERSLAQPIGNTWNPETAFANLVQPRVETKRGMIIDPIDSDALILKKVPRVDGNDKDEKSKISFAKSKLNKSRNRKKL